MVSLQEKINTEKSKLDTLDLLLAKYPDLEEYRGRWSTYYCSKLINPIADKYYLKHSCGCCDDAVLQICCYLEYKNTNETIKIFSNPAEISIGHKDYSMSCGDILWAKWDEKLRSHNINNDIIIKIQEAFANNRDINNDE